MSHTYNLSHAYLSHTYTVKHPTSVALSIGLLCSVPATLMWDKLLLPSFNTWLWDKVRVHCVTNYRWDKLGAGLHVLLLFCNLAYCLTDNVWLHVTEQWATGWLQLYYSKASTLGLNHTSCLESVSISSHSVALNKATDVGCFTVWVWLK